MKKLAQLILMTFVIVGISACGKMGELEAVKADSATPAIDQTAQMTEPELDILPHNSK